MVRCLDLFPDVPDDFLMPWATSLALESHVQKEFGVSLGIPEDRSGLRVFNLQDYKMPEALAWKQTVQYLSPQPRETLETLLAVPTPGHWFRLALIDDLEKPDRLKAFRYALRMDVDMLVVSYDPAGLADRQPLLQLMHSAAETGQVVVVIGPPIALD